ncbi:hypothetical protein [Lysinibacillus xylanilyticus]|nr:hypothetical protein [Lysinibacillus xylanilyticus]
MAKIQLLTAIISVAKAKRQQHGFICAKAKRQQQLQLQHQQHATE